MEKTFFVLERIYKMTRIPVRYFNETGEMTLFHKGYEPQTDPLICDEQLRERIIRSLSDDRLPILDFEEQFLCGACRDAMRNIIIFGPVNTVGITKEQLNQYKAQHNITDDSFFVKHRAVDEICAALATLSFSVSGQYISEIDIMMSRKNESPEAAQIRENAYMEYELDHAEQEAPRFNFSEEILFVKNIKEGNMEAIDRYAETHITTFNERRVGKLAEKSFKQNEYMACTSIILASRAAIEGGLDPLTAYLMSDVYLQRLEKCDTINCIYKLMREVSLGYAQKVKEKQLERSKYSYVEQCKSFIGKHLNRQFTLDEIADEIGINKSYLSRRFSDELGMGVQKYAQLKRIEAAANMLKFSEESILAISNYLCFNSQSHFGKVFKEHMGVTPQKYRDNNKLIDFKK